MRTREAYSERFEQIAQETYFGRLPTVQRDFLRREALVYRFSQQDLREISEIGVDLNMWGEPSIIEVWPEAPAGDLPPKKRRASVIDALRRHVERLRTTPKRYGVPAETTRSGELRILSSDRAHERPGLGFGRCPVASQRTLCCNLLTLDAVENCGFGCSYCSIQSFYHDNEIHFDSGFAEKLGSLELDPDRVYHIGTGQSSDSLMWGNRFGVLDALMDFARRHPNVILELKTKSKNVVYLLRSPIPANVICTWSLNPQKVIEHEEQRTAGFEERLRAARRVADRGIIVGFHFHPMVYYADWKTEYRDLFAKVVARFDPSEVALVSIGTLTFTKSLIRRIRDAGFRTRILQMPLAESNGKLSYPDAIKLELFSHAYQSLEAWHHRVFFYLCMESHHLWRPVLGMEHASNQAFEEAMKASHLKKIHDRRSRVDPRHRAHPSECP